MSTPRSSILGGSNPRILILLIFGGFLLFQLPRLINDPIGTLESLLFLGIALVVAVTVHEFSHAYSAYLLGDMTAHSQGRVSLNPIRHLDPWGSMMFLFASFGWGRPTPINPWNLRIGARPGLAIVSIAGPVSNILTAVVFSIPFYLGVLAVGDPGFLSQMFMLIVFLNVVLALFNLLPVAPLDGFKVAVGVLPREMALAVQRTEPYGYAILLGVIAADIFLDLGILNFILGPVSNAIIRVIWAPVLG